MFRSSIRAIAATGAALLLAGAMTGSVLAYAQEVHVPPAACTSVLDGIAHFHASPAVDHMQQTPAWGRTSRFVYDRCG